jgi:hypothetical protein
MRKEMKRFSVQTIIPGNSILVVIIGTILIIDGCVTMAPVNSSFESAKILRKGQIELMGNYSSYSLKSENQNGEKESEKVNNNYGFRLGYGINDRIDLKFRYERLVPAIEEDKEQLNGANYLALTPRFSIVKEHIAFGLDLGMYTYTLTDGSGSDQLVFLSPKFAFSYPSGKIFDLSLTTKFELLPWDDYYFLNMNLGMGIGPDREKFELRPEIGFTKDFDDFSYTYFTFGFALIFKLNTLKKLSEN